MTALLYTIVYGSLLIFAAAVAYRLFDYIRKPMHIRWELYPVAHEGKRAAYGGSYLEDVDWWKKPREKSRIGELKVMVPEILLLKAVWEHNRPLWFRTYPFHLGLYLIAAFIALTLAGALLLLLGAGDSFAARLLALLAAWLGPSGFLLGAGGATALLRYRMKNADLRRYSSREHFFNLIIFIVALVIGIFTWLGVDGDFGLLRSFMAGLISLNPVPLTNPLFALQIVIGFALLAYIPLTHMSHFFMKYFLYHDIRWGDEPNVDNPATQAKIGVVLSYPVSWSAAHIAGDGRKTWADVATFNPAAEAPAGKE